MIVIEIKNIDEEGNISKIGLDQLTKCKDVYITDSSFETLKYMELSDVENLKEFFSVFAVFNKSRTTLEEVCNRYLGI